MIVPPLNYTHNPKMEQALLLPLLAGERARVRGCRRAAGGRGLPPQSIQSNADLEIQVLLGLKHLETPAEFLPVGVLR
jgi:hypothetical protein